MITINRNKKNKKPVDIPDKWNELNSVQYLDVIKLLYEIFNGSDFDPENFRLKLLQKISGNKVLRFKFMKRTKIEKENRTTNFFILSDMFRFPIKYAYDNEEAYFKFPEKLRLKLVKYLPNEIYDHEFLEFLNNSQDLKPRVVFDLDFNRNLLPEFRYGAETYVGPSFNIDEHGVVQSDLIAEEYIDAFSYYNIFLKTNDEKFLSNI